MRLILHSSSFYIAGAIVLIVIALYLLISALGDDSSGLVTTHVERGTVAEIVSVSGVVEAENAAELAFPVVGTVTDVFVRTGDTVERGDALATLVSRTLVAERTDAVANLQAVLAERNELVSGPTSEARQVTSQTVENAKENLTRVIAEEAEDVKNARRALLSTALIAETKDPYQDATPPTVSGTYLCETTGTYTVDVYASGAASSYSYRIGGLESGTFDAFTDNPGRFGQCGLSLQFDEDSAYSRSTWTIEVPNTKSSSYTSNLNAYELALNNQENAIAAAENTLTLAEHEASLANAEPRSEALVRADAKVAQARARIELIDAQIADRSIIAPFDGIVTDVDILPGETATAEPVITMLAAGAFELTAQIPEIDITKLQIDQRAEAVFDARRSERVIGAVTYIAPLAYEIEGVAYFEAKVGFEEVPPWIRGGLNADIDIVVHEVTDVLRVPKRFIDTVGEAASVLLREGERIVPKEVELGFVGNNGFVEVIGLAEGVELIAP